MDNLDLRMNLWNHTADLLMTLVNRPIRLQIAASVLNPILHHPSGEDIVRLVNDETIRWRDRRT